MTNHESIPIRVLRNDVSKVIKRVEAGEQLDVTRNGTPVARIVPISPTTRWKTTDEFRASVADSPSDPAFMTLIQELRAGSFDDPFERWGSM